MRVSTFTNSSWYSMSVDKFPHQALHGTPWMLTGSTDSVVAYKNIFYTSIHHVSRADQNCAVLKHAESIVKHVETWPAVRQKGTVRASRKMCSGLKGSVTKPCKFISRVKHQKYCIMLDFFTFLHVFRVFCFFSSFFLLSFLFFLL